MAPCFRTGCFNLQRGSLVLRRGLRMGSRGGGQGTLAVAVAEPRVRGWFVTRPKIQQSGTMRRTALCALRAAVPPLATRRGRLGRRRPESGRPSWERRAPQRMPRAPAHREQQGRAFALESPTSPRSEPLQAGVPRATTPHNPRRSSQLDNKAHFQSPPATEEYPKKVFENHGELGAGDRAANAELGSRPGKCRASLAKCHGRKCNCNLA